MILQIDPHHPLILKPINLPNGNNPLIYPYQLNSVGPGINPDSKIIGAVPVIIDRFNNMSGKTAIDRLPIDLDKTGTFFANQAVKDRPVDEGPVSTVIDGPDNFSAGDPGRNPHRDCRSDT